MIPQTARDLVLALLEKTRAGDANWKKPRFSADRHTSIMLGGYVFTIFETRSGSIVIKLKGSADEDVFSIPVERDDPDFELASELLDLADPGSPRLESMLSDMQRLVMQAGPIG